MIYLLRPATKDYIWGGKRLAAEYGKQANSEIISEAWELSCHPDGPATVEPLGISLPEYLAENPAARGTNLEKFDDFPVLVKLIDAAKDLSIQVHPNNDYAMEHAGQLGKTEMWYVVDAAPGAFIYYGFKEDVTPEQFEEAIRENRLTDYLNYVSVQPGDSYFIQAGTIHAIGAGCLIAEVQQNSNVTYRVYDYDRKDSEGKGRQLHVEQAKDVASLKKMVQPRDFGTHIASCDYFTVDLLELDGEETLTVDDSSFAHLMVLQGSVKVCSGDETLAAPLGQSVFADAGTGEVSLTGKAKVLVTYIV